MDYIYSNLNSDLVDATSDIEITWTAYNTLPTASADLYMTVGVVSINNADNVYLCIKRGSNYIWKLICKAGGQLETPVISIEGSLVSWAAITDAASYDVYKNDTLLTSVTQPQIELSTLLTEIGTYRIHVIAKGATGSEFAASEKSNVVEYVVMSKYYKYVDDTQLTDIPTACEGVNLPTDFITNGLQVNYKTIGEQYEYLAYPATYPDLVDVVQSGQHVLGNYSKLANVTKDTVSYKVYRTTLPQIYDDSDYVYYVFKSN